MISGVQAKDLGHGDIKFTGSIIDAPCSIDGASGDQTVVLGQIAAHQMAKGGKSTPVPFFIQLHDCDTTTMKSATVTFIGAANPDSTLSDTFATVGQAKKEQVVPGAHVTFSVSTPSAEMSSPQQYTDTSGDTRSAFLIARAMTKEAFTVTAECNGHQVVFSGLIVASGEGGLLLSLSPKEIKAGGELTAEIHASGPGGVVWTGLPVVVSIAKEARKYFSFPGCTPAWRAELRCDAKGAAPQEILCEQTAPRETQGVLTLQSGVVVRPVTLTVTD